MIPHSREIKAVKWMKPDEVTEPGAYWVVDLRGKDNKYHVSNIRRDNEGRLYELGVMGHYLIEWNSRHRLMGPLEVPIYVRER